MKSLELQAWKVLEKVFYLFVEIPRHKGQPMQKPCILSLSVSVHTTRNHSPHLLFVFSGLFKTGRQTERNNNPSLQFVA
jgi:hypothetical protein